ncbi:unnamed protein product [Prunus armeniaca]|uniref:Uncharacterized protein n=1 Tax=Prunus armeniaca TaxID=36596 RepID=A0A6J5WF12_PRUAR|nr:unnamed protein product [Prunus armeniaca]
MLEELVEFPCMLKWRGACNAHAIWRVTTHDRGWEGDVAVFVVEEVKKNNHSNLVVVVYWLVSHHDLDSGCADGYVTLFANDGKTLDSELEAVEGMKLDRGYISPYFITNQNNKKCESENPLIIIHEKKISSINAVV